MQDLCRKIVIGCTILVLAAGLGNIVKAEPTGILDDGLLFTFNSSSAFVLNTTMVDTLEVANVLFSMTFGHEGEPVPSGQLTYMECQFTFDPDSLIFVDAIPTTAWPKSGFFDTTYISPGHWKLEWWGASIDPPNDNKTAFAELTFQVKCLEEGSLPGIHLDQSNCMALVADVPYDAGVFADGWVSIPDYEAYFYFDDLDLTGMVGQEVILPVRASSNFAMWAIRHDITYDDTKLEFLGLDYDSLIVFPQCWSPGCPSPGDNPIAVPLLADYYGWVDIMPAEDNTMIYCLRFKVLADPQWDGGSTLVEFTEENRHCLVGKWVGTCGYLSEGPGYPATFDYDVDGSTVALERYEAFYKAVVGDNNIYPGGDFDFWYDIQMLNRFYAGMPNSSTTYKGAITANLEVAEEADFLSTSPYENELYLRTLHDIPRSAAEGVSIYQDWDVDMDNYWGPQEDYGNLVRLRLNYTGDLPATYTDRFLDPIGFASEAPYNGYGSTARVSDINLNDLDEPFVVADSVNGRLSWEAEALEVSMGEFYSGSGYGTSITRNLNIRHNFELHDFSITLTTGNDYDIVSVVPQLTSVDVEEVSCDGDCTSYRIFSLPGASFEATGESWTTVVGITYELDHFCYCNNSYSDAVAFTDMYMTDGEGIERHFVYNDNMTLSVNCGGCPDPSCPVLFSYSGDEYVRENPLLTACEQSNYTEIVTDYYHVRSPVSSDDGLVRFRLMELEEEITYLEEFELITVDHSSATSVACAVDGEIFTYDEVVHPVAAVDQYGEDRLVDVANSDGRLFESDEPGYLIVTFPAAEYNGTTPIGYKVIPPPKNACDITKANEDDKDRTQTELAQLTVDFQDREGNWVEGPAIPPRVDLTSEIVTSNPELTAGLSVVSMRISWSDSYSTDAVLQYIPSPEEPKIGTWSVSDHTVTYADPAGKMWSGFNTGESLVMVKGDVLDVVFECTDTEGLDATRDYIIRAVGRYQPDYSTYSHLTPGQFQLYDAYPNPFNPSTTISYDLPTGTDVIVEVYNLLGQKVATLVDAYQESGHHSVEWNTTGSSEAMASGVYFYRLTTDDFTQSKKMILVK